MQRGKLNNASRRGARQKGEQQHNEENNRAKKRVAT
jgi:hypothetical protein